MPACLGVVTVFLFSTQITVEWFINVASQIRDALLIKAQ